MNFWGTDDLVFYFMVWWTNAASDDWLFLCSKTSLLTNSKNLKLEVYVTREFASWPISRVWVFSSQARLGHSSISSLGILPVKSSDTLNLVQFWVNVDFVGMKV